MTVPGRLQQLSAVAGDLLGDQRAVALLRAQTRRLTPGREGRGAHEIREHDRGQPSARVLELHAGLSPPDRGVPPLPRGASAYQRRSVV